MKMENDVLTHVSGKVTSINVSVGDQVATDDVLATVG
jgi:biotin carboxyl carrier protein